MELGSILCGREGDYVSIRVSTSTKKTSFDEKEGDCDTKIECVERRTVDGVREGTSLESCDLGGRIKYAGQRQVRKKGG